MDQYKQKLMSRNGQVVILLAREFLSYSIGDRIKTIKEYAKQYNTGSGTIQFALKFLQKEGAITLEPRGHLGTYIIDVNFKKLWEISDLGLIMGVMPLPYSKRYEGLATGLYKAFEEVNIPFSLAFMRGSTKRVEALRLGKYNFAIMSKLAAELESEENEDIEIIYEFSENSYVGDHVIIFRESGEKEIKDGMRVAIDPISADQNMLTIYECGEKEVEFVETSYSQILQKLNNDEIDVAIWNKDEIEEKSLNFNIVPIKESKTAKIKKDDTIATIVVNMENIILKDVFNKFVNLDRIETIQKKVINNEMIPIY